MTTQTINKPSTSTHAPMRLGDLFRRAAIESKHIAPSHPDLQIRDICLDSRQAAPGSLFLAIAGTSKDGAAYIADAVARGAVAVVTDRPSEVPVGVACIQVPCVRRATSRLAAAFFGLQDIQARGALKVVGITGTNGKSTTAFMIRQILTAAGHPTALFGTIEYDLISRKIEANLTTPDPVTLVTHLVEAAKAGAKHAVMEVSSHSLDQHRTDGITFSAGIFTNLTQDHLDYHKTMEAYLRAKILLFESLPTDATAILNADDPASDEIAKHCTTPIIRYGLGSKADLRAEVLSQTRSGGTFLLMHGNNKTEIRTSLVGRHNVYNALAAAATGLALGLTWETIAQGLSDLTDVPGRLQRVPSADRGFDVFVDYAHTDDALRNVLTALRPLTTGKLWCVFGCGGDRDRTKRPKMARAVAEGADSFVITSDNPRTEDPLAIIREIQEGFTPDAFKKGITEPDRAKAISYAVSQLHAGDVLLIAGKGHENYQILGGTKVHFDDVEVAEAAIARR